MNFIKSLFKLFIRYTLICSVNVVKYSSKNFKRGAATYNKLVCHIT